MNITKGKADVIDAYKNQMIDDIFNVFPFKFTVSDYAAPLLFHYKQREIVSILSNFAFAIKQTRSASTIL